MSRLIRDYPHLVEQINGMEKQCLAAIAQRVIVENVQLSEEQAADRLYLMMKRLKEVRRLLEQKPAI